MLRWNVGSVDFGSAVTADTTRTATLTNVGGATAAGVAIIANGSYTVTSNCPSSLAAAATCTATFTLPYTNAGGLRSGLGVAVSTDGGSAIVALSGTVTTIGSDASNPGRSCLAIKQANASAADGAYWVDPDGGGAVAPAQVYCDMTADGGGWMLSLAVSAKDTANSFTGDLGFTNVTTAWSSSSPSGDLTAIGMGDYKSKLYGQVSANDLMVSWALNGDTTSTRLTRNDWIVAPNALTSYGNLMKKFQQSVVPSAEDRFWVQEPTIRLNSDYSATAADRWVNGTFNNAACLGLGIRGWDDADEGMLFLYNVNGSCPGDAIETVMIVNGPRNLHGQSYAVAGGDLQGGANGANACTNAAAGATCLRATAQYLVWER
jgi:hypothetical protein